MITGMDEEEIKNLLEIDDSKSVGRLCPYSHCAI